ncbi:MAG TPA: mandelate racemase/muconate lactonizing enzyme family protein [Solirubrobacteraceae bacterium]|nr:mandelate racemase/muconate lactonizing enzyme family protein [Solirubrobacteraceae bacterium]
MLITAIETFPLRIPFKPGQASAASGWGPGERPAVDSLLVKVTTDQGLEGWGEALGFGAAAVTQRAIDDLIAPLCVGRNASRIASLMLDVQKELQVFGRGGLVTHALSAVDIALWDIAGKAAGAPLHCLLGGGATHLASYASLEAYDDPTVVRDRVRRVLEDGFNSLKLHERQPVAIRAAREAAGPGVDIMVDVNCAWTVSQVRGLAPELRDFRLKWLEEPVWPPENYEGLAELRATEEIPIAAGENVSTLMDFDRLLSAGSVDFVQPSPAKMGGVTELCKVFPVAALHNVTVMPHSFYDGPGLLAAIQVMAALGDVDGMIEWRYFDLEARIYGDALSPEGGRIEVPQGPGLGIDPDPEVIRAYLRA